MKTYYVLFAGDVYLFPTIPDISKQVTASGNGHKDAVNTSSPLTSG